MSATPDIKPLISEAARHFGTIHALFVVGEDDFERSKLVSRYLGTIADEVGHAGLFAISCAAVASIIPANIIENYPNAIFKLETPDNLPDDDSGRSIRAVGQFVASVSGSDLDTAWAIFLGWVPEDVLERPVPDSVGYFFGGLMSLVCHTHMENKTEPQTSADQRRRLQQEVKHQVYARARRRGRKR